MDKDHLIDLISNSLLNESKNSDSTKNLSDFKNYLERLNLDQLRTMSKEFILQYDFKIFYCLLNNQYFLKIVIIKKIKEICLKYIEVIF